ncbi:hypothetical protein [Aestuariimicrobium ganziense]|uniref:hypothetical protein n=1 Tax=Aestuariimicrobium ganziense TaxID=2773677 RepID=UPI001943AFCB|nr:hypothetical protein [Aestuariimicrobium ganziense]
MTSPDNLRPSSQSAVITFEERPPGDRGVRDTVAAVGKPYGWRCASRDEQGWVDYFNSGRRYWLITDGDRTIGLLELDIVGQVVEIDTFGLVPEAVASRCVTRRSWTGPPS